MLDSISAKTAERIAIVLTGIALSSAGLALAEALGWIPSTGPWAGATAGAVVGSLIFWSRARRP